MEPLPVATLGHAWASVSKSFVHKIWGFLLQQHHDHHPEPTQPPKPCAQANFCTYSVYRAIRNLGLLPQGQGTPSHTRKWGKHRQAKKLRRPCPQPSRCGSWLRAVKRPHGTRYDGAETSRHNRSVPAHRLASGINGQVPAEVHPPLLHEQQPPHY